LEIGAKDEGRAIDEKDMVAGTDGAGRGGHGVVVTAIRDRCQTSEQIIVLAPALHLAMPLPNASLPIRIVLDLGRGSDLERVEFFG